MHLLSGMGYLPEELRESSIGQQRWQAERLLTNMVYDPSCTSGIGWNLKQPAGDVAAKGTALARYLARAATTGPRIFVDAAVVRR